jgi:hypothetical protein
MAKKSAESKFVTGAKGTKSPKPKSLTPGTKSTKKGDMKREGKYARSVPY